MKKIIFGLLISVLVLVSVLVTIYLLNYNEFNIAQFGKHSVIIIDEKIAEYEKNDLLIIEKNDNADIKEGDYIFFYDVSSEDNIINYGKVNQASKVNETETTFTMSGNTPISSEYVIGKSETATAIAGIGLILGLFASQWGFLFLVILPISILFIYQIYLFAVELHNEKKLKNKKGSKKE